jgi:SAM-dependent methyltransferase
VIEMQPLAFDVATSLRCPACSGADIWPVLTVPRVPALCNVLLPTAAAARALPCGQIHLVVCRSCSMLFNARFESSLAVYTEGYENSLHFSGHFDGYARTLAEHLGRRFGGRGALAVEVGSGAGDFATLLATSGFGHVVGFDPSLPASRAELRGKARVDLVRGSLANAPHGLLADLVVCRHVLEHLDRPVETLNEMRTVLGRFGTALYVEVPDGTHMLEAGSVWDLIHEHVGYFTQPALVRALARAGWAVTATGRSFGEQYLWAEAVVDCGQRPNPTGAPSGDVDELLEPAARFRDEYRRRVEHWSQYLLAEGAAGRRVGVWGVGSKGVSFLTSVTDTSAVSAVIDVNPRKCGRFVPLVGLPVVEPAAAVGRVDTVLVMNPVYLDEVRTIGAAVGLEADYVVVT